MRVDCKKLKEYPFEEPIFNNRGHITRRVRNGLENVLNSYTRTAIEHAKATDNNPRNYTVTGISVVGSGANNRVVSDLDLLVLVPGLDEVSLRNLTLILKMMYFTDRQKQEAIDVYLRKEDAYPSRPSVDITLQVSKILNKYNKKLQE